MTDTAAYYQSTPANAYAKAVHKAMADGRAYAFPFDDVGQQESLVHANDPTSVTVTIPDLDGASAPAEEAPTPTPSSSASPTATPTTTAPTATPAPSNGSATTSRRVMVTLRPDAAGHATLTFGPGTKAGLVTIVVEGGSTSVVAILGPGTVRADLTGPAGQLPVTVSSTAELGEVTIQPG